MIFQNQQMFLKRIKDELNALINARRKSQLNQKQHYLSQILDLKQRFFLHIYVWTAISLPKLANYLDTFFHLTISTAGISKMMIRVGDILRPVYFEILENIKIGAIIYTDETGWRVRGKLHWLWVFANKKSAFYWPDKSRGGPGIGYNISGNLSDTANPAKDEDATGLGYYFRLGYQQLGLFGGLEYAVSNLTLENQADTTAAEEDWDGKEVGVFIGYELPVLLRFWGGYIFDSELDRNTTGKSSKTYSGNGYKLGVGYKIIPLVSLNLEYKSFTYDEELDDKGVTSAGIRPPSGNLG